MTLVFDYDGTLHDTARLYGSAFREAYAGLVSDGYAPEKIYTDEELKHWVGVNPPEMWKRFMPELPEEIRQKTSGSIGEKMVSNIKKGNTRLYEGVPEILDRLKRAGYRMLMLSNCRRAYMDAHREHFGLDKWFDDYFCAEDYAFAPKEDIFIRLKEQYPDDKYIIIGDRDSDFKTGLVHGIPVIGCAYGFGTEEERSVCTRVIADIRELPEAVLLLS